MVKNGIVHITLPETESPIRANVRIFDTNGAQVYQNQITGSTLITFDLPDGNYFISVKKDNYHKVGKIIVKN